MKKTIRDFDLNNKKVIIRVDYNVPIKDGIILDDSRIVKSLDTLKYAVDNNAKVILMSHLGRIKTEEDKKNNSLQIVASRLSKLLNRDVIFVPSTRGDELECTINNLNPGDILLMENTRYEDLDGKKESSNDEELGKYWASLGDIFINDAFGTCHRAHASNVGIASNIESGIGFLVEKELKELSILDNPVRPFAVILGGAKVHDKINLIENLVNIADYILIGGGMAYTFLASSGLNIGKSILDEESIDFCKRILEENKDKIILPIDSVNENNGNIKEVFVSDINENDVGLDIGHSTIKLFKQYLNESKTIMWNGPVGYTEREEFTNGTKELCEALKNIEATKIIGGGDTASIVINLGYEKYMTHISTGGGASLEYLEGKTLPGIDIIGDK